VGDGSDFEGECYYSGNCDVVGAFRRGICEDPAYQSNQQLCELFSVWNTDEEICVGLRYADSGGGTTVPLMGKEGAEGDNTFTYMNQGEIPYLKIYDSSTGEFGDGYILYLEPSVELPGWELNAIETIFGTSTGFYTYGCTHLNATNYDGTVIVDDGSCEYETVQIGHQVWMTENLKATHYRNGDEMLYWYYDNNTSNSEIYGKLYPWHTATDERGTCPEGWHAPSDDEFTVLTNYLGGEAIAGGKMKEAGLEHWDSPNEGATNESGFTVLPAGYRLSNNNVSYNMGNMGYFWSTIENDEYYAWTRTMYHDNILATRSLNHKDNAFSIRCLSDETQTGTILVPENFATIQEALFYAIEGDTILVSAGTYYENIIWPETNGIKLIGSGVDNCIIDGNQQASVIRFEGDLGGIIDTTTLITGFTIQNGNAQGDHPYHDGGGISLINSSPTLTGVTFSGNTAGAAGGGICLLSSSNPTLTGVTFSGNTAGDAGGGMFLRSSPTLENSILWGNLPDEIYIEDSGTPIITYSNIQGGWEGEGNIDADPQFTDPESGGYTLQSTSPCIDAGDPNSPLDPDGTRADMGAYATYQGCSHSDACNYNPEATVDDGSCLYNDCAGICDGDAVIDNCDICDNDSLTDCYNLNISLHEGANLISFPCLPEDVSIENIFAGCNAVIGLGVGAVNLDGTWVGSLTAVSQDDGYWVKVSEDTTIGIEDCVPVSYDSDGEVVYDIHHVDLISYPFITSQSIADALGDAASNVYALAGQGVAAMNDAGAWVGSLEAFEGSHGYWLLATDDFSFSFNSTDANGNGIPRAVILQAVPEVYSYHQSTKQAFYFIEDIENIIVNDWILAYNGDKVIGARQWTGSIIDVPAMGDGGSDFTKGYIEAGGLPSFKILRGDELINLEGDVPSWENNKLYMVSSLTEAVVLPETFSLDRAYPNPFNPTTALSFSIPVDSEVSLSIYNMQGREVSTLIDANMDAGYHSVVWDANSYASGVYFVKMVAGEFVNTQKLMLIK